MICAGSPSTEERPVAHSRTSGSVSSRGWRPPGPHGRPLRPRVVEDFDRPSCPGDSAFQAMSVRMPRVGEDDGRVRLLRLAIDWRPRLIMNRRRPASHLLQERKNCWIPSAVFLLEAIGSPLARWTTCQPWNTSGRSSWSRHRSMERALGCRHGERSTLGLRRVGPVRRRDRRRAGNNAEGMPSGEPSSWSPSPPPKGPGRRAAIHRPGRRPRRDSGGRPGLDGPPSATTGGATNPRAPRDLGIPPGIVRARASSSHHLGERQAAIGRIPGLLAGVEIADQFRGIEKAYRRTARTQEDDPDPIVEFTQSLRDRDPRTDRSAGSTACNRTVVEPPIQAFRRRRWA